MLYILYIYIFFIYIYICVIFNNPYAQVSPCTLQLNFAAIASGVGTAPFKLGINGHAQCIGVSGIPGGSG